MPLPPRFSTNATGTFCAHTAKVRWPIIVQNMIDDLGSELSLEIEGTNKHQQGLIIKKQLTEFRENIINDNQLTKFSEDDVLVGGVPSSFNEYLENHKGTTWLNSEWLFAEIYIYRFINVLFKKQSLWYSFDIFNKVKQTTFESSFHGVVELAIRYKNLIHELETHEHDESVLQILFKEFIEISLWGNATDLSLLLNATLEDIKSLQGARARADSEEKIVINDTDKAWETIFKNNGKEDVRIDFVLDNSGFELYADLMLAAFLLKTKLATHCIFHCKDIPYMVSDVMLKDFDILVKDLKDRSFFPTTEGSIESQSLELFADDITKLVISQQLEFREDSFWTTNLDYYNLDPSDTKYHGKELHEDLLNSDLVIFKGDLNYRKLTGDRTWDRTTPWETSIGPLATNGITSLSLRTCKADVQVDLPEGLDEQLSAEWEKENPGQGSWWCSSGKYAVICFAGKKK